MADEAGMEKGELRKLLTIAKKTPVNAAIGMSKDGTPALLLHKIKQPRALSKELEAGTSELKNMRWGEFYVDEEKDPKTLVARLNKPASGLARKLVKVVKFAGFSKVVLQFEDGTTEAGEDEETPAAEPGAALPAIAAAPPEASPDSPPQASDLGPITARITTLVKRMMPLISADPSRGDTLKGVAKEAQAALQSRDVGQAEAAAARLEEVIIGFEQAAPPADPATIAKARSAWIAVRQRLDLDLHKLLDAVRETYEGHDGLAEIERRVQTELDGVLGSLDDELARKLDDLGKAADADRPKLAAEAKQIVARYQQHVASNKLLGVIDDNPFVPLTVQKTTNAALSAIVRNIR